MKDYLTELIVTGALTVFAMLLRAWLSQLSKTLEKITTRQDAQALDLHEHKLDDVRMWTRIDGDVRTIYKRIDREFREHANERGGSMNG